MKRYLAFYGSVYYPSGGMEDFIGDYDTEKDALNAITEKLNTDKDYYDTEEKRWQYCWAHIYDTETRKEVWCK
jgi:hypothetical protein